LVSIFGFELRKAPINKPDENKTFALPQSDDGAVTIQSGSYYGTYVDLDGIVRNEIELITRYREMAMQPEIESAVDDIVNEAIVMEDSGHSVDIITDNLKQPQSVKKAIEDEFGNILKLLNFGNMGSDIFRRWYIDGRMFYHLIIDDKRPAEGIQEIRYIDPRRIRKVREIEKGIDQRTGMEIIKKTVEYYMYNERGVIGTQSNMGAKIATDAIVNVNSGLMDSKRAMVLSYLHKAIKPLNNLRMVEDATVIYRLSRAPERRIFYVDVGNMPTIKAEQYLKDIMTKYRNKLVYDSTTGEIRDDRKHMSMLEDFWLPRREGSRGTEIDTLPAGQNLGDIEDVHYFERKLYKSLGVPIGRLDPQNGFSLGRSTEITRDELKFTKYVEKLRSRFSILFDDIMRVQLVLKKICSVEEWNEFKEDIFYDFLKDNNFTELKEAELLSNRLQLLAQADPFVGKYLSMAYVQKNILRLDDDEVEEINQEIQDEQSQLAPPMDSNGNPIDSEGNPVDPTGGMAPQGQPPGYEPPNQEQDNEDDNGLPPESKYMINPEDIESPEKR